MPESDRNQFNYVFLKSGNVFSLDRVIGHGLSFLNDVPFDHFRV